MTSSYQSSCCDQNANTIISAPLSQELFNSLLLRAGEANCYQRKNNKRDDYHVGATSSSPITISSSGSSSPSVLAPPVQLSSGFFQSGYPSGIDRSDTSSISSDNPSNLNTPSANGRPVPGSWTVGRETSREALEKFQKEALPQVVDSSKRLQQALGLRCDEAFQAPTAMYSGHGAVTVENAVDFNPALRHLRSSNAGLGVQTRQMAHRYGCGRRAGHGRTNLGIAEEKQRSGIGERILQEQQTRGPEKPLTLRESLLLHGRQSYGNQAKTVLRSLSFHDLTPDMRTGGFQNEMLAHFEADQEGRTRLVCYEVDVPSSERRQPAYSANGIPIIQTERWISFLISTPLITFKAGSSHTTATAQPCALPPNLPQNNGGHPPTSWVIFAAPISAITSHSPSKDNIISRTNYGTEILRPVNRYDYDFSHNGIPSFEFMNKGDVLGSAIGTYLDDTVTGPFLTGKGVAAYEGDGEDIIPRPKKKEAVTTAGPNQNAAATYAATPYRLRRRGCLVAEGDLDDSDHDVDEDEEESENAEAATGLPVKDDAARWADVENWPQEMSNSYWWEGASARFTEDRKTWARIKESMARGCCRIVARVEEDAATQVREMWRARLEKQQRQRQCGGGVWNDE